MLINYEIDFILYCKNDMNTNNLNYYYSNVNLFYSED